MDRLPAHRLEVADESIAEVGAAAVANAVGPFPRQTRLSHHAVVSPSSARLPDPSRMVFLLRRRWSQR
jgi:hypothetical protein